MLGRSHTSQPASAQHYHHPSWTWYISGLYVGPLVRHCHQATRCGPWDDPEDTDCGIPCLSSSLHIRGPETERELAAAVVAYAQCRDGIAAEAVQGKCWRIVWTGEAVAAVSLGTCLDVAVLRDLVESTGRWAAGDAAKRAEAIGSAVVPDTAVEPARTGFAVAAYLVACQVSSEVRGYSSHDCLGGEVESENEVCRVCADDDDVPFAVLPLPCPYYIHCRDTQLQQILVLQESPCR